MIKRRFLAAALAAIPLVASAQLGGRRRERAGTGERTGAGRAGAQKPEADLIEAALFEFQEDLNLKDPQQDAWQRYSDAVRALAADARRQAKARPEEITDVLQRLDRAVDSARNRYAALEEAADRAHALWRVLDPEQRTAADPRLANLALQAAGQSSVRR